MKRKSLALSAALVAASVVGAGAYAQDATKSNPGATGQTQNAGNMTNKADHTKVVPDRADLNPGAAPTLRAMDANAQRQHDPDRAVKTSETAQGGSDRQTRDMTNKADHTKVVPDRADLNPGAAPTLRAMDANAQRQHDPDRGVKTSETAQGGSDLQTRDWSKVDKDNNGLVSPEEMEAWLKQAGPQATPKK